VLCWVFRLFRLVPNKSDKLKILIKANYPPNKVYCERCKITFQAYEGYPEQYESVFSVTPTSISGKFIIFSFGDETDFES